ncbi:MAG TPA: hypothetical protein VJN96_17970 [Vicinamibacterales bacterium]|nr:hypothetical protein [Vicinamibacterales bacterium]
MSTRVFVVNGDDEALDRCAQILRAEGAAVTTVPATACPPPLDGYARVVDVIVAIANAQRDVRSLDALAEELKPHVSAAAIRGWFYAVHLRASDVLALGRLIRAFRVSRARGVRLAGALGASDRRTIERFFERAGLEDGHADAAPQTLEELLSRQRLVRDPGLLEEIFAAVRRLP